MAKRSHLSDEEDIFATNEDDSTTTTSGEASTQLDTYKQQLAQVTEALRQDPENEELKQLYKDLSELVALSEVLALLSCPLNSIQEMKNEESDSDGAEYSKRKRRKTSSDEEESDSDVELSSYWMDAVDDPRLEIKVTGDNLPKAPISRFDDAELNLPTPLLHNIKNILQYRYPTQIQRYALPLLKAHRDLMATAQTGSGKTGAFLMPTIARMLSEELPKKPLHYTQQYPVFLILAPTRELAVQIHEESQKLVHGTALSSAVIYGGASYAEQAKQVSLGCDVLVATPGRLLDMLQREKISLSRTSFLCLDEADRMLDMGFEKDIRKIVHGKDLPTARQTMLFSATFPAEIKKLAQDFLSDFVLLEVGAVGKRKNITQMVKFVTPDDKRSRLLQEIKGTSEEQLILVFVEKKKSAEAVCWYLQKNNCPAVAIHGDRSQSEREAALHSFKSGECRILVATDVAARGLDVEHVGHVINFDMPANIEDYIHRIGRTGRINNAGLATSFIYNNNKKIIPHLISILQQNDQPVPAWLKQILNAPVDNKQ